jgi:hypothetical protein
MLSSSNEAVARITSRACSKIFGLSGFSGSANIGVVSPVFHCWTAISSRIRPNLWVFLLKRPKIESNSR